MNSIESRAWAWVPVPAKQALTQWNC
jgi:hypothetical protein